MAVVRLFFDHRTRQGTTIQAIRLEGAGASRLLGRPLLFQFEGLSLQPPELLDGPLISILMIAMTLEGADELHVPGSVSLEALRNLHAWQEAWVHMAPAVFHQVRIVPERVAGTSPPPQPAAISAFSGGLDSMFTAIRHSKGSVSDGAYGLTHVLTVHGFDIPPENLEGFNRLMNRVRPALDELGLTPVVVRTNAVHPNPRSPTVMPQPYYFSQAAQIAGLFHVLVGDFGYGLIASTEPYSKLVLPWGSNPATDYLLSSDRLRVVHDGAGFTRTEKARYLLDHPDVLRTLRVCLGEGDRNCGECEKCIRTRLNFMAAGEANPPCFDSPFSEEMVDKLVAWSPTVLNEALSTIAYAERAGLSAPWLDRLRRKASELEASSSRAEWRARYLNERPRAAS